MDALKNVLEGVLGKFVCDDAGQFRGQCPQLIRYFMIKCGVEWPGRTGNGNVVIDTLVSDYGGYYMTEADSIKKGYRICSSDMKGSSVGHCWIELYLDGKWVIYQQNNGGEKTANFGEGTVRCVSKSDKRASGVYNVRYAGSPSVDLVIEVNKPKPAPTPEPTPEPVKEEMPEWVKEFINDLGAFLANYKKESK